MSNDNPTQSPTPNPTPQCTLHGPEGEQLHGTFAELGPQLQSRIKDGTAAGWHLLPYQGAEVTPEPEPETEPEAKPQWDYSATALSQVSDGDPCPMANCSGELMESPSGQIGCTKWRPTAKGGSNCKVHEHIVGDIFTPPAPTPAPTPAPAPKPEPVRVTEFTSTTGVSGEVSEIARIRVTEQREALKRMGFAVKDTVYAPGSRVVGVGHENFKASRMDWEASPEMGDACEAVAKVITDERRYQEIVTLSAINLEEAFVTMKDGSQVQIERGGLKAFTQILSKGVNPRTCERTKLLPAWAWSKGLTGGEFQGLMDERKIRPEFEDQQIQLLARRDPSGKPTIYSVATPSYSYYGADQVLRQISRSFAGKGYRGSVTYDEESTRMKGEAWAHLDRVVDLSAGDVFKTGITFKAGDHGGSGGGIDIFLAYLRNLCLNLYILDKGVVKLAQIRHRGSSYGVEARIGEAVGKGDRAFEGFNAQYNFIKATPAEAIFGTNDIEEIVKKLTKNPEIRKAVSASVATSLLLDGFKDTAAELGVTWNDDQTVTLANIVNAVTRLHDRVPVYVGEKDPAEQIGRAGHALMQAWTGKLNGPQISA